MSASSTERKGSLWTGGAGIVDRGHDDENAIGAAGAGLRHLIGVIHEILAQGMYRPGERGEEVRRLEGVGQDRKAARAASLVGGRKRSRSNWSRIRLAFLISATSA